MVLIVVRLVEIVSVTKKGQATIPKRLREKYGIKGKALIEESEDGILLKPLPSPSEDFGSLRDFFKGKDSRQLLKEARREEFKVEKELLKHVRKANLRF